jgi:hypothetical protein
MQVSNPGWLRSNQLGDLHQAAGVVPLGLAQFSDDVLDRVRNLDAHYTRKRYGQVNLFRANMEAPGFMPEVIPSVGPKAPSRGIYSQYTLIPGDASRRMVFALLVKGWQPPSIARWMLCVISSGGRFAAAAEGSTTVEGVNGGPHSVAAVVTPDLIRGPELYGHGMPCPIPTLSLSHSVTIPVPHHGNP